MIENVLFIPPTTSSTDAGRGGLGGIAQEATSEDGGQHFEKSQFDELQSEKSHVNESMYLYCSIKIMIFDATFGN